MLSMLLYLLLSLVLGIVIGYLFGRGGISAAEVQRDYILRTEAVRQQGELQATLDNCRRQAEEFRQQRERTSLSLEASKTQVDLLQEQLNQAAVRLNEEQQRHEEAREKLLSLSREHTELRKDFEFLEGNLEQQRKEFREFQATAKQEFANVSSELLQASGEQLRSAHARALESMLTPLKDNLSEFKLQIDQKFTEEARTQATLKAQIEQLTAMNQSLSDEARQLTMALKGDNKQQGDWGELQLQQLLEAAGLCAGTHFSMQSSFRDGEGQQKRPDCIIYLPDERHIIIDCKVSLTAYERYCSCETAEDEKQALREHVTSVRAHIRNLASKRYPQLDQLKSPDYVLLYIPLEPAFIAAVRAAPKLYTEALRADIVLVSPSTLLATMRTVSFVWSRQDQQENALHIAQVGKELYEKFAGFVENMRDVGTRLNAASNSYEKAINQLCDSPKYNTTLLAKANKLCELGVQSDKKIDP